MGGAIQETQLDGLRVAILATDGFEQSELTEPRKALDAAGAKTEVISPKVGKVRGWNHQEWGQEVNVDKALDDADPRGYDALVLPGGVMNPDSLRMQPKAVAFVKSFFDSGKPVAAICHGPWTVVESGAAEGRRMTSWPSLKTDICNAGGEWLDQEVVVHANLVTSRKPDDIPAFNREVLKMLAESRSSLAPPGPDPKAVSELHCETVSDSNPSGFKNDPNDPTSPNEAIERSRRTLRPSPLKGTSRPQK